MSRHGRSRAHGGPTRAAAPQPGHSGGDEPAEARDDWIVVRGQISRDDYDRLRAYMKLHALRHQAQAVRSLLNFAMTTLATTPPPIRNP
jgi:hypothetical protein